MILKLNGKQKLFGLEASGLGKKLIKAMVQLYRKDPKGGEHLKYAHFNVHEILSLLVANDVLDGLITKGQLDDSNTKNQLKKYGLKIYLGRHNDLSMSGLPEDMRKQYKNKITTILCNTKIGNGFRDLLTDDNSVAFAIRETVEEGQGLDQAEICPPYNTDDDDNYDIGYEENP